MTAAAANGNPSFVLAPDARILALEELPASLRRDLAPEPGDVVVDRAGQRRQSQLISADTAALLEAFREPATVTEALLALSRQQGTEPLGLLEAAFPAIRTLVEMELLVAADRGNDGGAAMRARLRPGDRCGGYSVLRALRTLEDTEVYQARDDAGDVVAIKIAGPRATSAVCDAIAREAALLRRLEGLAVPRVLQEGTYEGAPYFVMRWVEGLPVSLRADQIRLNDPSDRRSLVRLCQKTAQAYAALHDAGILHGDVRASNVLVGRDDKVYLIDFGMARDLRSEPAQPAMRSLEFDSLEPEAAPPLLRGEIRPQTALSEQFALAVLLYRLASGRPYRTPAADQEKALRDILTREAMLPFAAERGRAWRELERPLRRALARRPDRRFPSVRALADALAVLRGSSPKAARIGDDATGGFVDSLLQAACAVGATPEELFPSASPTSLHDGAAGLGWFLYRAALARRDGLLLAQADRWARLAGALEDRAAPPSSPLHDASGPLLLRCLVARAHGDTREADGALRGFLARLDGPPACRELFQGRAGALAAAATLYDALSVEAKPTAFPDLEAWLGAALKDAEGWIAAQGAIGAETALRHLGMAHGWAGVLYAVLQACAVLNRVPKDSTVARLEELASFATPIGRGCGWVGTATVLPGQPATPDYAPGWCSGSAGYVLLWLSAFETTGLVRYGDLAEAAAWHAWEHPDRGGNLCCGLAGRALALSRLAQGTGEESWHRRAARLLAIGLREAAVDADPDLALFRGSLGLGLAALELEHPFGCAFPLYEPMRWCRP